MQGTHKCQGQARPQVSDQSSHQAGKTQALEPEGSRKSWWIGQTGYLEADRLAAETREEVGWLLGQDIPGRPWEAGATREMGGKQQVWLRGGLAPGRAGWGEVRRLGRAALRAGVAHQDIRKDRDPGRGAGKGVKDPGRSSMGASPCALDRGLQSPAGRPGVPQSPRRPQGPVRWPTASCPFRLEPGRPTLGRVLSQSEGLTRNKA